MKTLIISRHGKAMEGTEGQPDIVRGLSPRGYKDLRLIAKELIKKNLVPGVIFSSPAVRAVETARHLTGYFHDCTVPVIPRDSLYGVFSTDMFGFIDSVCPDEDLVMIIGHNPSLMILIEHLSGLVLESFPTSATVVLDFDVKDWKGLGKVRGTLRKLFIPKELR